MKALATYPPDVAYTTLSEDSTHIVVPLDIHAPTQGLAQGFYDLLTNIRATATQEEALTLAVARAEGFIIAIDADIDVLVTHILNAAAAKLGKTSAFYLFLTGDQTPGEIRAPVLAEELDTVKTWVGPLKGCADPLLVGYGDALEDKINEADKRLTDLAKAEQALSEFKEIGGRKQLTDSANALRAVTYGALNELQSTPAGAGLPADFCDRVFQFERARRNRQAPTIHELEKKLAASAKEHAALLSQLAEAKAAEAAALQAKVNKKAKAIEGALAAAKKKAAGAQAEVAALEGQLSLS